MATARPFCRPTVRRKISRNLIPGLGMVVALLSFGLLPLACSNSVPTVVGGAGSGGHSSGGAGGSSGKGGGGGSTTGGSGGRRSGTGSSSGGVAGGSAAAGSSGDDVDAGDVDGGLPGDEDDGGDISEAGSGDGESISCTDKITNGSETDVDCGGGDCLKCGAGKICQKDSDCRSGVCTSGKCLDPFVPTATISNDNGSNRWKVTAGNTVLEVDKQGGKIVGFSLDGTNVLVINDACTGSVFWIAPQSEWNENGWPAPPEMDENATYTISSKDNVLSMTGPTGTDGFTLKKRIWANVEHQTFTIEYSFKNGSTAVAHKAPWEISRLYPGGLTFFPTAEEPVVLGGTNQWDPFQAVPFTYNDGVAWFKYQKADFTHDIKGGANGSEGWAAHINCGTGLEKSCASGTKSMVFIKEWEDTTSETPGDKEIEIFANNGHNYIEFEQLGDYQTVPAGATVVWTMHWTLRYLPTNLAPKPGSADLLTWVRGQLL